MHPLPALVRQDLAPVAVSASLTEPRHRQRVQVLTTPPPATGTLKELAGEQARATEQARQREARRRRRLRLATWCGAAPLVAPETINWSITGL